MMTKKKALENFLPNGRPSDYKEEYNELVYRLSLLGLTDKEMARFLEIGESTLNLWKQKHPKFSESMWRGKAIADSIVAESLFHRAIGYSHSENKIFHYQGKPVVVPTVKHYPPDTQAASLWLRNRQPDRWRDTKEFNLLPPEEERRTPAEVQARIKELDEKMAYLEAQL